MASGEWFFLVFVRIAATILNVPTFGQAFYGSVVEPLKTGHA
jgi:hypothetical protein